MGLLKQSQNKKGRKFVSAAPKMVSFSQLPALKKDTIFGAAETNFRPFLFCDCFSMIKIFGPIVYQTTNQSRLRTSDNKCIFIFCHKMRITSLK